MKKNFTLLPVIIFLFAVPPFNLLKAQCPVGYSTAVVNWDNLDYLTRNGTYSTFVTNAMVQTQYFTIGVNRMTINFPFGAMTTNGDNTTNTAEAGSYGSGADVEYSNNGTITLTFDNTVRNLQFSLYDIDLSQRVRVTATDDAGTPVALIINMTNVLTGVVTITGNGTTAAVATATNTTLANNDRRGSINISIAGNNPVAATGVKTVTIEMGYSGGAAGNFWMSDITACVTGSFPLNYYASQQPFIGQPAYYLVTPDNNSVYLMNPLTGVCDWLFSEPSSPWVNSMAYDHVNKILYYVSDNPSPVSTNKALKKYDFNTETRSIVVNDITTLGIPIFDIVVESAGAAFYNGSLFIGIEGTNSGRNSNRESIIWRIDFDATQNPIQVSQTFAFPADNGSGTLTHDWGDFTIKDGVLYDFNTGNSGSTSQFIHYNMQTGLSTNYPTGGNPAPIQAGQIWNGDLYWTGGQSPELGRVARYNENGTIGPKIIATVTDCSPSWVGRAGDASDPFRPKSDFGDAPASYDPISNDRATHEYDCDLRIGATFDREWDKTSSADASSDGSDEDGIATVAVLTPGASVTFAQDVDVYNNTGSNAILAGWLDINGNGIFEPSEGRTLTVPSSGSMQTFTLTWSSISVSLPIGSTTFLRTRLTSSSNGLTVNNSTGWKANGEVEDYEVHVVSILPVNLLGFSAENINDTRVLLKWSTENEINLKGFEVERSKNEMNWEKIGYVSAYGNNQSSNAYQYYDNDPYSGKSYYRLRLISNDNSYKYSSVISVQLQSFFTGLKISPNPATDLVRLTFYYDKPELIKVNVISGTGQLISRKEVQVTEGINVITLNDWERVFPGLYVIEVITSKKRMSAKVSIPGH